MKWPGRSQAAENKVPTVVTYDRRTAGISTWGFSSESHYEQNSPDREYCSWWKTCIDEKHYQKLRSMDRDAAPRSQQDVDKWTEDYLRCLYIWVSSKLEPEVPPGKDWAQAKVEFIFSVPTTWSQRTVTKFKSLALRAGWGSSPAHVVGIGLTEAEAAAVYVACEASVIFQDGDNMLVADCGGGTTDLNLMRVKSMRGNVPLLEQLDVVEGKAVGSTQIDLAFEDLVYQRLRQADAAMPMHLDLQATAWSMMKSAEYLNAKCDVGLATSFADIVISVPVPGLNYEYQNHASRIFNQKMQFNNSDLEALFDHQVAGLFNLIDHQLKRFSASHPLDQVKHLVLSGGLSNSAYVQRRLKERYAMNTNTFSNAATLQVHVSPEPQLAVCKGICFDKVRNAQPGRSILEWRRCRMSYGTDCKMLYNPNNPEHHGKLTQRDPLDGKDYITSSVAWFIRKGEAIDVSKPIMQNFTRKITPGDPRRAFSDKVIVSQLDNEFLPVQYGQGRGADVLCKITCDLSTADESKFKIKNRHWWQSKKKYMRVRYDVRVIVGAADITFELWFDGQRLSRTDAIEVEWQAAAPPENNQHDAPVPINGFGMNGNGRRW